VELEKHRRLPPARVHDAERNVLVRSRRTLHQATAASGLVGPVISEARRRLHVTGEIVALAIVVPLTFSVAANQNLPEWQRSFLYATALGTMVIDGYLLGKWAQDRPVG
jgi:hypothetical protein